MSEEYEEIAEGDEPVVVEHVTVVEEPSPAGEMLRFFALVIILGVVVLVVAAVRPLIFDRIVPAVMGEGIVVTTLEPPVTEETEESNTPEESVEAGESTEEEAANTTDSSNEGTASEENTASEAESSDANEAGTQEETTNESTAGETAENQNTPITHTVRQGETLQKIAAQYGIALQELIAANTLPNPNLIHDGDILVIPQASNP